MLPEPLLAFDTASADVTEALARVNALQRRYPEARDSGRILPNVVEAVRIELTYHSNAIEGNTLSLRDTHLVIEGRAPSGGKSMREVYEARNHDRALRAIEAWAAERPADSPTTAPDMLDIHGMVLADIDPSNAGRLRAERVLIAGSRFVPPGSQKFGELVPRMLDLASRSGLHPVLQAAEFHYNLVAIHPFRDGNGRTARLMMNYHLLRRGYPHAIINVADREEYLASLDDANDGRWERFAMFVVRSVEQSIQRLLD